jgi:acyl-CoA thioester hydrolase
MTATQYRVIYGDTDQMGVVYYANYLAFFERGRCEYMRERSFDYATFEREGFFLPVVDAYVKYKQPARFDDLITIDANITEATRITAQFSYTISRGDVILATGTTTHACVNREGRPVRWPESIKRGLLPEGLQTS